MTTKADAVEVQEEVKTEETAAETKTEASKEKKVTKKDVAKALAREAEVKEEETAEATETAYPLFQLREHSREVLGVKPEIFDGVFATATEKELTKSEAKKRIEAFLKKEVK